MATNKKLIEDLIEEIIKMKKSLPNGNIIRIEKAIEQMQKNQDEMKEDIRYIRKTILDPEHGLVVRINKNTEFREEREEKIPFYDKELNDFHNMKTWKKTITRGLWLIYSAIIGLIIKILFWS